MNRKKLFNLRLPVLFASAFAVGILFAVAAEYFYLDGGFIALCCAVAFAAGALIGAVRRKLSCAVVALLSALFFAVGAVYCFCVVSFYGQNEVFYDSALYISGTVTEVGVSSNGNTYIVIDNLSFGSDKVGGKLIGYLLETAGDYCRKGYTVSFYSQPELLSLFADGGIDFRAAKGIKYSCIIAAGMQARYGFSLFGEIEYAVENALYSALDSETAAVCLAMLTGNSDMISQGTLSAFRYGGVAHVFAVSGLHIGVIYGALSAFFKKVRLPVVLSVFIKIAVVIFYVGVCNFTPSSVRAAVMCSVLSTAPLFKRRYDFFNSLAFAAIILFIINPLYLFGVGFMLSFGAAFGIALLSHNLSSVMFFLPKKIRSAISVGWSAQFVILPVSACSFGYISAAGLFLNLVFVPLISVLYVVLFIATFISLIIPAASGFLLTFAAAPIQFVTNIITVAGLERASVFVDWGGWIYLPFAALVACFTDKLNFRISLRGVISAVALTSVVCAFTLPAYGNAVSVKFAAGYDGGYILIESRSGCILVVTQNIDGVSEAVCDRADVLVIAGGDESLDAYFALDSHFNGVYVRGGLTSSLPVYENFYSSDSFCVDGAEFNFNGDALCIKVGGVTFCASYEEKGDTYAGEAEGELCLYSYATYDAVLFYGEESYDLARSGALEFIMTGREIAAFVSPKG